MALIKVLTETLSAAVKKVLSFVQLEAHLHAPHYALVCETEREFPMGERELKRRGMCSTIFPTRFEV